MLYYMWEIDYNLTNIIQIFDFMYSIYLIALGFPDENFAVNGPGTMPVVDLFKLSDFSE